jgi:cobalamin synthase
MEEYLFVILVFIFSRASIFSALELEYHNESKFIHSLQTSFQASKILKVGLLPLNLLSKFILKKLQKKLGFLNGDTLGFNIELIELILLNIGVAFC